MKKKLINLRGLKEVLSENQLKGILGGSGSGSGNAYCYRCYGEASDYAHTCYGSRDSCMDKFGDDCPVGGFFWAC